MERTCYCEDALRYQNRYKHTLAHRRNQILSTCGPGPHSSLGISCRHSVTETCLDLTHPAYGLRVAILQAMLSVFSSVEHNPTDSPNTLALPCRFNSVRPRASAGKAPLSPDGNWARICLFHFPVIGPLRGRLREEKGSLRRFLCRRGLWCHFTKLWHLLVFYAHEQGRWMGREKHLLPSLATWVWSLRPAW